MSGVGILVRLAVRRNRVFYLIWLFALVITVPATARAYETVIPPGPQAETMMAALGGNPTMRAMLGPAFDLSAAGGFTVWRVGTFVAAMAAIMAVLGVIRATRAEEEDGRSELVLAGAVDRQAPLAAGVIVAAGASALLGLLVTVAMIAVGTPATGAIAFGLGIALVALVFVGVAAVAAQLTSTARSARGIALGTLAVAYLVRAMADGAADDSALRSLHWVSPVEWMALARPYADERWWVFGLPVVVCVGLLGLAQGLRGRRDLGAGLLPVRLGPAEAPTGLSSEVGLAWRLQRGPVIGWTVGTVVFALAIGSLSTGFGQIISESPTMAAIFERMGGSKVLVDAFFSAMLGIVSVLLALFAVQLFARLRQEERRGHAELLLSTAATRLRLAGSHLGVAVLAPTVLAVLGGALLAVTQARADHDLGLLATVAGGSLALTPAIWLILGVAMLVHGWAPRWDGLVWAVLGWSLTMVWIGPVLGLPQWLTDLTPWSQLPRIPATAMEWAPVLIETVIAVGLVVLGLVGYRRRDLT